MSVAAERANATRGKWSLTTLQYARARPLTTPLISMSMSGVDSDPQTTRREIFDCVLLSQLTSEERVLYPPPATGAHTPNFAQMGSIVGTFTEDGQEYYYINSEHGDVRRVRPTTSVCVMMTYADKCSSILPKNYESIEQTLLLSLVSHLTPLT
jgi:hypothetical protein